MNSKVKTILQVAEAIAVASVPGAAVVDKVAHDIHDKKDVTESIPDLAEAVIQVIEATSDVNIADAGKFKLAVAQIQAGFKLLDAALVHKV